MNDVFELDLNGLNEIMKSSEMQSALSGAGSAVVNAAGGDYAMRVHLGSFTAICNVYPDSKAAAKENNQNNTLVKALGAAGLQME